MGTITISRPAYLGQTVSTDYRPQFHGSTSGVDWLAKWHSV